MSYEFDREAHRDAQEMERWSILDCADDIEEQKEFEMSAEEHHEYLCSILVKLVDSELTNTELKDLASALGIKVDDFYTCKHYERKAT